MANTAISHLETRRICLNPTHPMAFSTVMKYTVDSYPGYWGVQSNASSDGVGIAVLLDTDVTGHSNLLPFVNGFKGRAGSAWERHDIDEAWDFSEAEDYAVPVWYSGEVAAFLDAATTGAASAAYYATQMWRAHSTAGKVRHHVASDGGSYTHIARSTRYLASGDSVTYFGIGAFKDWGAWPK